MSAAGPGRPLVRAAIGLGANLGDPAATLGDAFLALDRLPGTRLTARSGLYRTAPVGVLGQPDYFNAAAILESTLSARALLDALLSIEAGQGRTRDYHHAPRTLDLDLLLYGDKQIDEPVLQIPHPRMHLRAFVLVPLTEIAPATAIPGRGRAVDLLPRVADQPIERLAD